MVSLPYRPAVGLAADWRPCGPGGPPDHEHHEASFATFVPFGPREAACSQAIRERPAVVTLGERDYTAAVTSAAGSGLAAGAVYDALIRRLGPPVADRVRTP